MGGQITTADFPFDRRLRAGTAVPSGFKLRSPVASLTSFNDFMADTAVIAATFGCHKDTLTSIAHGLTNHGNHPPFKLFYSFLRAKKWPEPKHIRPLLLPIFLFHRHASIDETAIACQALFSPFLRGEYAFTAL